MKHTWPMAEMERAALYPVNIFLTTQLESLVRSRSPRATSAAELTTRARCPAWTIAPAAVFSRVSISRIPSSQFQPPLRLRDLLFHFFHHFFQHIAPVPLGFIEPRFQLIQIRAQQLLHFRFDLRTTTS